MRQSTNPPLRRGRPHTGFGPPRRTHRQPREPENCDHSYFTVVFDMVGGRLYLTQRSTLTRLRNEAERFATDSAAWHAYVARRRLIRMPVSPTIRLYLTHTPTRSEATHALPPQS